MDGLPGRITEVWSSLPATRRVLLAVTGGAVVGLGLLLYSWSSSTQFVTSTPARELTNVVIAQRGFQASSRIIGVADEMLADLVNLRR